MIKSDLSAKISELLDSNEVRFRLVNDEELDVTSIEIDADTDEAWINLAPKAEDPDDGYYIGRHRQQD